MLARDHIEVLNLFADRIQAGVPATARVLFDLSFVPLSALFGRRGFAAPFVESATAFVQHPLAFLTYGAIAFALIALGLMTMGIGLVIALPLIACATYAAWRDLIPATPSPPAQTP